MITRDDMVPMLECVLTYGKRGGLSREQIEWLLKDKERGDYFERILWLSFRKRLA